MPKPIKAISSRTLNVLKSELANIKIMPRVAQLKEDLNKKQEEIKQAEMITQNLKDKIVELKDKQQTCLNKFLKEMPEIFIKEGLFDHIDINYLIDHVARMHRKDTNIIIVKTSEMIVNALFKSMIKEGYVRSHRIKDHIMK